MLLCVHVLTRAPTTQLSYLMFHYVTGIPFHSDLHGGVYDNLTLWEQIDEGAQYTPAKKWLLIFPITLCVHPPFLPPKCAETLERLLSNTR